MPGGRNLKALHAKAVGSAVKSKSDTVTGTARGSLIRLTNLLVGRPSIARGPVASTRLVLHKAFLAPLPYS